MLNKEIRPMNKDERQASVQREQANGPSRMDILETVVAIMEEEMDRMHELLAVMSDAPEIQHAIAVAQMKKGRKEVPVHETIKYELSEFAKANYGTGYQKD